jgi:hypothetical protein
MSYEATDAILDQIDQADLSATAYRTAMRLWRLAAGNGGVAHLPRPQMTLLCGTESDGTMKNHLCQIAKAGIIEYGVTGDVVFIRLLLWICHAQRDAHHAERDNDDGDYHDERDAHHARNDAHHAERAKSASTSHVRARALGRLGRSLTTTEKRKKPTYPPTSQAPALTGEQQLAFELLVDSEVGMAHRVATELALMLPPQDIYRAVDKWLPDHRAEIVGPGALKHRLEALKPSNARMVSLSAGFRDSELFHRHRLPDEMIADPERKQYNIDDGAAREPRKKYSV